MPIIRTNSILPKFIVDKAIQLSITNYELRIFNNPVINYELQITNYELSNPLSQYPINLEAGDGRGKIGDRRR